MTVFDWLDPAERPLFNNGRGSVDLTTQFGFIEEVQLPVLQLRSSGARRAIEHLHRKVNLPSYGKLDENKHFTGGRFMETAMLDDVWRYEVLICADAWNPAPFTSRR